MNVYITGDTHGFNGIMKRLNKFSLGISEGPGILIVLGDFGLLWREDTYQEQIARVESFMQEFLPDYVLAFLDGNHENFDLLKKLPVVNKWGGEVGQVSKNIFRLMTGNIYNIKNKTFAIYGGAVSIDKEYRTKNVDWWEEEIPSTKIFNLMADNIFRQNNEVDFLLTHTCSTLDMHLVDKYPFTGKLSDPVAHDIKIIKNGTKIKQLHAFGHMHIDKVVDDGKLLAVYENIYKIL